jgi:hypothetical protein
MGPPTGARKTWRSVTLVEGTLQTLALEIPCAATMMMHAAAGLHSLF